MTAINLKVVAIVAGLLVVGGGAYVVVERQAHQDGAEAVQQEDGSGQTSLRALVSAGRDVKCTFTSSAGGQMSEGTVYIGGGSMRGDFKTLATAQGDIESHMVMRDNTNYLWSSSMQQGIKMGIDAAAQTSASAQGTGSQAAVSYDSQVDYHCEPWSVDASVFELPSEVTFMDVGAMMQGATTSGTGTSVSGSAGVSGSVNAGAAHVDGSAGASADIKAQQCAACASLPAAQQAQCKMALQCP